MAETNENANKRAHSRVPVEVLVNYRLMQGEKVLGVPFEKQTTEKTSKTINVSLGGMLISADQHLKVKDYLRLDISLPNRADPFTVFAEVAWADEKGVGLRFVAVQEEDRESLETYLKTNQ